MSYVTLTDADFLRILYAVLSLEVRQMNAADRKYCVPESLSRAWQHPAVRRINAALEKVSGDDGHLLNTVEDIIVHGAWMTDFLPVPHREASEEGNRLIAVLQTIKQDSQYKNLEIVAGFTFHFWRPEQHHNEALRMMDGPESPLTSYPKAFRLSHEVSQYDASWPS